MDGHKLALVLFVAKTCFVVFFGSLGLDKASLLLNITVGLLLLEAWSIRRLLMLELSRLKRGTECNTQHLEIGKMRKCSDREKHFGA